MGASFSDDSYVVLRRPVRLHDSGLEATPRPLPDWQSTLQQRIAEQERKDAAEGVAPPPPDDAADVADLPALSPGVLALLAADLQRRDLASPHCSTLWRAMVRNVGSLPMGRWWPHDPRYEPTRTLPRAAFGLHHPREREYVPLLLTHAQAREYAHVARQRVAFADSYRWSWGNLQAPCIKFAGFMGLAALMPANFGPWRTLLVGGGLLASFLPLSASAMTAARARYPLPDWYVAQAITLGEASDFLASHGRALKHVRESREEHGYLPSLMGIRERSMSENLQGRTPLEESTTELLFAPDDTDGVLTIPGRLMDALGPESNRTAVQRATHRDGFLRRALDDGTGIFSGDRFLADYSPRQMRNMVAERRKQENMLKEKLRQGITNLPDIRDGGEGRTDAGATLGLGGMGGVGIVDPAHFVAAAPPSLSSAPPAATPSTLAAKPAA